MRLEVVLVDIKPSNAAESTVAKHAPYVAATYGAASFAWNKGSGYFAGTAAAAGFVTGATNGTLLWECLDRWGDTTAMIENTLNM